MASFVVFEHHLWLNLIEIKGADKVPFLDSPVSPSGLFGPAVEGLCAAWSWRRMFRSVLLWSKLRKKSDKPVGTASQLHEHGKNSSKPEGFIF
ncbi:hypothetical protein QQF64_022187 [Cirrhinus molitorella]|uniref:Uncharacterized protein n=1 Tax=Cirrhinus molitorella TaxID=172907 RepID=A0ABR3L7G3_9TELE